MAHLTRRLLGSTGTLGRVLRPQILQTPGPYAPANLFRAQSSKALSSNGDVPIITPEGVDLEAFPWIEGNAPRKRTILPHLWLRDNCRCPLCVNPDTKQRNFNTFDIPANIRPLEARMDGASLSVIWNHESHRSKYDWRFINNYLSKDTSDPGLLKKRLWVASDIDKSRLNVSYESVMGVDGPDEDAGVRRLTDIVMKYGLVFVDCTPATPEDTQKLLERIAFVRVTHYGGFYDFIPDLAKADTAYTNLGLPAHTDNTYFTDPSGLQAFHLLSHVPLTAPMQSLAEAREDTHHDRHHAAAADAGLGGESLLVDGFHAAAVLRAEDPRAYEILATVRLPWHASGNKGIAIAPDRRYPVLEEVDGELHRVRWNNDDRGVVPFDGGFSPSEWYEAARKWDAILRQKEMEYWVQLTPGTTLIFDNWRVLHGRSPFEGRRRICGGYINRDDFISRWRNTNLKPEEVVSRVVG